MDERRTAPQTIAAARAGVSVATARRIERDPWPPSERREPRHWRTRVDPLALVCESFIVPLLERAPGLKPVTVLHELAITGSPRLLILDEHCAALDPRTARQRACGPLHPRSLRLPHAQLHGGAGRHDGGGPRSGRLVLLRKRSLRGHSTALERGEALSEFPGCSGSCAEVRDQSTGSMFLESSRSGRCCCEIRDVAL